MKVKQLFILGITTLSTLPIWASGTSCNLLNTPLPTNKIFSETEIQQYQDRLKRECSLSMKYSNVKDKLSEHALIPEQVTAYQAMRFIRREEYESYKPSNTPVQKIYQIFNSQYSLPVEQKSTIIWDNWIAGINQLPQELNRLSTNSNEKFTILDLKRIHKGFFTQSDEKGDASNMPDPGYFKPYFPQADILYWWEISDAELASSTEIVNSNNTYYREMGLIDAKKPAAIYDVLRIKPAPDSNNSSRTVNGLFSGDNRANPEHVDRALGLLNRALIAARNGQHLFIGEHLLSPIQTAMLIQQFYVATHPFAEGNGRTSRFLQEVLTQFTGHPHMSSGDLMSGDVIIKINDYYEKAMNKTSDLLDVTNRCAQEYRKISKDQLSYDCRIL